MLILVRSSYYELYAFMKPLARAVKLSQEAPYITNCIRIAKKTYARSKKIEIEDEAAMPL